MTSADGQWVWDVNLKENVWQYRSPMLADSNNQVEKEVTQIKDPKKA